MPKRRHDDPVIRAALDAFIAQFDTYQDAADALGVKKQYFYQVRRGAKPVPEYILTKIGLKRTVVPVEAKS